MKVVIPAKAKSGRVPNKNWRPFYKDKSLVEVKIEQLIKLFKPEDIYLSCDDPSKKEIADKYSIQFMLRDSLFAKDETSWSDVVTGIIDQIECDENEEIMWAEATSPLFNSYDLLISDWNASKGTHDSILTVSECREFLIDAQGRAVNFNYGRWHCDSQKLDPLYTMDSTFIMSKKNYLYFHYPVGKKPLIHVIEGKAIEIDTMHEFEMAQKIFAENQIQ
jgi:CMP-N-acetylneuraminic acid synthetase